MDTKRPMQARLTHHQDQPDLLGYLYREGSTVYFAVPMGDVSAARTVRDTMAKGLVIVSRAELGPKA